MRVHVLIKTLLCVLLAATAAQAQITTSNVNVRVTGKHCDELKDVYLVINGKDREESWVKLKPAGTCRWKTDLGEGSITTSTAKFSLRVGVARSDCQRAVANETDMTASLEFACCDQSPLRNVGVKIEPPMKVTYVRDVRPFTEAGIPGIPCLERATFSDGQVAIGGTQFSGENVYLHLWPVNSKQQRAGLLLNEIEIDKGPQVLNRDEVAQRLMVQRAQGKAAIAPTLSPNARSLDLKKLAEVNFQRARIEVIK